MKRLPGILLAVTTVTWALVVVMTLGNYSQYQDRYALASSAPQVNQVANEFLVDVTLLFVIAVAVTSVCVVVALTLARHHDTDAS